MVCNDCRACTGAEPLVFAIAARKGGRIQKPGTEQPECFEQTHHSDGAGCKKSSMNLLHSIFDAAAGLPWIAYVPAFVGVVAGLLLLIAGNKVLKPVTIVIGTAVGGLLGVVSLTGLLEGHTYNCPAALASMVLGGAAGAVLALIIFRAALALAGAATFAGVAVLVGCAVFAHMHPVESKIAGAELVAQNNLIAVSHVLDPEPDIGTPERVVGTAKIAAGYAWDQAGVAWDSIPVSARGQLVLLGLGAAVVGLLAGALAPRRVEAVVTALGGAGLALVSVTWLVRAMEVPGQSLFDHGPVGWLIIWLSLGMAGAAVQMYSAGSKPAAA